MHDSPNPPKPNTIQPPTPLVLNAADRFEVVIGQFLSAFEPSLARMGTYEADLEAYNLTGLAIRNIEGVLQLARTDLVLLPPALVLARSAFETCLRALWLITPPDPFAREARWVAHLRDEVQYYSRLSARYNRIGADASVLNEKASALSGFVEGVAACLPQGYMPPSRAPSFESILESLGLASAYPIYTILSQYTHGTHFATWLYRRNLGTMKQSGEFTTPDQWYVPFTASLWSFHTICDRLIAVVPDGPSQVADDMALRNAQEAISALRKDPA